MNINVGALAVLAVCVWLVVVAVRRGRRMWPRIGLLGVVGLILVTATLTSRGVVRRDVVRVGSEHPGDLGIHVGIKETELGDLPASVCVGEDGIEVRAGDATVSAPSFAPPVPPPSGNRTERSRPDLLAPSGADAAVYWRGSDLVVVGRAHRDDLLRHDPDDMELVAGREELGAEVRALAARRLAELFEEIAAGRVSLPASAASLRSLGRIPASDRARLAEALARDFDKGTQETVSPPQDPRNDSASHSARAEIRVAISELAARVVEEERRRELGRDATLRNEASRIRTVVVCIVAVALAAVVLKAMARRTAGAALRD